MLRKICGYYLVYIKILFIVLGSHERNNGMSTNIMIVLHEFFDKFNISSENGTTNLSEINLVEN